ncbi:hypothetical protein AcV5_001861 [Taiwanofungus camphoratus]|nr:hypothetical protein AcV5_001861 [Antrodia cinnamomea]KAI0925374.1 hypothetical protein AcV7_005636 [Antrodia cinnamomea]
MPPARRRVSYVIPPPSEPIPRLQLPPHGVPRNGATGPLLIPSHAPPSPTHQPSSPKGPPHPRHRLGVASLALDTSTQLVGRAVPEGILYTGGRDGLVISWDLGLPMKRRVHRYGVPHSGGDARRWEIMTNWADDIIEEEADENEEVRSDGDVLGEVTGKVRRKAASVRQAIPFEEQWETDLEAFETCKTNSPSTQFRQSAQMHSDWVNDILLCNHNQTLISASSDGTVRAWNPHAYGHGATLQEPTTIGMHADYVRCLAHCRDQRWIASGSFDRTIKLWDLPSSGVSSTSPLITLNPPDASGPKSSVYALATDPYGSIVASGSPERVIRLWDPRSGKRIGKLVGHTDNIRAILLSEDARYLLTGSADASIKLWSLSSQRCLHTFTHHTDSVWSLFSQHPTLELFYSGDRSGLVCKVDVEGCSDVSEGECIVLCQDLSERASGLAAAEGINKIVTMDDNLLWTASGSSSVKRWRVPPRRTVRAASLTTAPTELTVSVESPAASPMAGEFSREHSTPNSGKRNSFDLSGARGSPPRSASASSPALHDYGHVHHRSSSPPPLKKGHRTSLSPSVLSSASVTPPDHDPEREGEETWYGIPFESLVRLTSPHESFPGFNGPGTLFRGHDPEIATLYSAASIRSMPRLTRALPSVFQSQSHHQAQRSTSPSRGDTVYSPSRVGEETQTLHPGARARAAFEEREVAADAVPLRHEPDEVVHGEHGLVRCAMLNDRVHALTVDTAGEVAVWDMVRGVCRGRFLNEDVAAASFCGSDASISVDGDGVEKERRERSPREALETVRERIEGEAVVTSWATVDTKTGVLTVHLNERCFEAEIYADEAGYISDRRFGDETRLNIGKWVLRNLFSGFIREEQRAMARRARDASGHESGQHRLQRGSASTRTELNGHSPERRRRSSSDASRQSSTVMHGPKSASIVVSPHMLPAISPTELSAPRTSPLMTPLIPLQIGARDSILSPIPQSPSDTTPMPRSPQRSHTLDGAAGSSPSDYFSMRPRRGSISTAGSASAPDDFSAWGGKPTDPSGLQTPTTPTTGGLMGRLRAFGKSTKRQASEIGSIHPGGTLSSGEGASGVGDNSSQTLSKNPAQALLSGPINPPSSIEAPSLPIPSNTSIIISEEALSGWTTLYRGHVSGIAGDVRTLEEAMPMWLMEYLLANRAPATPVNKISFVMLPFPTKDPNEQLPELLNTAQSKLTASRFLRVRKLTNHVR